MQETKVKQEEQKETGEAEEDIQRGICSVLKRDKKNLPLYQAHVKRLEKGM